MGFVYTVAARAIAETTTGTILEIDPAADRPVKVRSIEVTQQNDVGDAQEEMLDITAETGATTTGTGTSATPNAVNARRATAGFTAKHTMTADGTGGTRVIQHAESANIRVGWYYRPTEEEMITVRPGELFEIRLNTAPADQLDIAITAKVEEIG